LGTNNERPLIILVLSAGRGTRMESDLAKVLHEVGGRPMVEYVLDTAEELRPEKTIVVVGHQAGKVREVVAGRAECALQEPQLGTGHAVMCARRLFEESPGDLLLLYGDVPLITPETARNIVDTHRNGSFSGTVLTAVLDDPTGYGRIIRKQDGSVDRIVEHKDASEEEKKVREINTGICCFRIPDILPVLGELSDDNAQGEYYITDAFELLNRRGLRVGAAAARDPEEVEGVNTLEQLAHVSNMISRRKSG